MEKRNNKYIDWSHICMAFAIALFIVGLFSLGSGNDKFSKYVGTGCLIAAALPFLVMIILSVKDSNVNREFDKEESEKEKYEEYLRLKQKYGDKK